MVPKTKRRVPPARGQGNFVLDDESLNLVGDEAGYLDHQNFDTESPRTDYSRLSQSSEPLALRQSADSSSTLCEEADPLGVHMKEVISVISRLDGLGLQQLSIQLPKCVVLGEQSSGKSSVIEAISGIRTPRASGTCTRCPLFINLECSNNLQARWNARITLRKNYKYTSKPGLKFPGWTPNPDVQEVEFAACSSPDELEDAIYRAQLALVHPLEDASTFLENAIPDLNEDQRLKVGFSPNIVCIYVAHPSLPNLSFYDLPGIIGQSDNPSDVVVVKNLVAEYVRDPDALVIVACSLSADIATSTAAGFARDEWGAAARCVGVLTKPDLLAPGTLDQDLQKVLSNKKFSLGHGYFVVKNPDQAGLDKGLTHATARDQENHFFSTNEPWRSRFQAYHGRFGTYNLQEYLSKNLAGQMLKALPAIYEQVRARLEEVERDLQNMPEPPTHGAVRTISDLLFEFSEHIRKEMESEFPYRSWSNFWDDAQQRFMDGLSALKPKMNTKGDLDIGIYTSTLPGQSAEDAICVSDGDDNDIDTNLCPETPSKKRKYDTGTPGSTSKRFSTPAIPTPSKEKPVRGLDYTPFKKVFQLDKVREHLNVTSKSKMPNYIQPKVIEDMVLMTIKNLSVPMKKFFADLECGLKGHVRDIFDRHFGTRADTQLHAEAWRIVEDVLNTSMAEQSVTMANDTLQDELEGPRMFHKDIFEREKNATLELYRKARSSARLKMYQKEQAEHGQTWDEGRFRREGTIKVIEQEPYESEINVVAEVTSYYVVAARRFHDSICMRIESKLFKRLRTKLRDDLEDGLGIQGEDGARKAVQLLAEPPTQAARRRQLTAMKNALIEGQRHLDELQAKHVNRPSAVPSFGLSFSHSTTPLPEEMEDITPSSRVRR